MTTCQELLLARIHYSVKQGLSLAAACPSMSGRLVQCKPTHRTKSRGVEEHGGAGPMWQEGARLLHRCLA